MEGIPQAKPTAFGRLGGDRKGFKKGQGKGRERLNPPETELDGGKSSF